MEKASAQRRRNIKVSIIGLINDEKFTVEGTGHVDPVAGEARLTLSYSRVPPMWHPRLYSDPLVLLGAYREEAGGQNFASLARGDLVRYRAVSTIDFGFGLLVRKTATVWLDPADIWQAEYAMFGASRVGEVIGVRSYREHLIAIVDPAADEDVMGIGYAIWDLPDNKTVQALVSARYKEEGGVRAALRQIRSFDVTMDVSRDGRETTANYRRLNIRSLGTE